MDKEALSKAVKRRVVAEMQSHTRLNQINESFVGTLTRVLGWAGLTMTGASAAVNIGAILAGVIGAPAILVAGLTAASVAGGIFSFNVFMGGARSFEIDGLKARMESVKQIIEERDSVLAAMYRNKTPRLESQFTKLTKRMEKEGKALKTFIKRNEKAIRSGMVEMQESDADKYINQLKAFAELAEKGAHTNNKRLATHEVR